MHGEVEREEQEIEHVPVDVPQLIIVCFAVAAVAEILMNREPVKDLDVKKCLPWIFNNNLSGYFTKIY